MKQLIASIGILLLMSTSIFAQKNKQRFQEKVESSKIAFITEKLQLTPDESKGFWPLYNQYEADREQIRTEKNRKADLTLMSDQEVEAHLLRSFEIEARLLDLKKNYFQKFKHVISVRKIVKLQKAERAFRKRLVDRLKRRERQKQ